MTTGQPPLLKTITQNSLTIHDHQEHTISDKPRFDLAFFLLRVCR